MGLVAGNRGGITKTTRDRVYLLEPGLPIAITNNGVASYTLTAATSRVTQVFDGAQVNGYAIRLFDHGLQTGQAVVYRASSNTVVGGLKANTAYYVIRINNDTIKLAESLEKAINHDAIAIRTPTGDGHHSLTQLKLLSFSNVEHLQGGDKNDTLLMFGSGQLTGSWDGGKGQNSARVLLDPAATIEGTDHRVWTITAPDTGGRGDRQTGFLANTGVTFDQTAVSTDPSATDVELKKEIVLRNHRLLTGQAVAYQTLSGADIGGLTSNKIYYVIRVDSNTIKLAKDVDEVSAGTGISLSNSIEPTKPIANGKHRLTPIDARTVNVFTKDKIGSDTINLHGHKLESGQLVRFHVESGSTPTGLTLNPPDYKVIRVDENTIKLDDPSNAQTPLSLGTVSGDSNYSLIAKTSLVTKVFDQSAVKLNQQSGFIYLPSHELLTGQAVVYRAGNDHFIRRDDAGIISPLENNLVYYVIRSDENWIQLAESLAEARAKNAIAIRTPPGDSHHSLTRVFGLNRTGSLVGGGDHDTVALLASGRLSGQAEGGGGFNTFVGPDVDSTWTGFDAVHKRADRIVRSDDKDAVDLTVAGVNTLSHTLNFSSSHGLKPGDAIVYRATVKTTGKKKATEPIPGLKDDMTFFVIGVDDHNIRLAASRDDAFAEKRIELDFFSTTGTGHTVSRATLFTDFQSMAGGTADDSIGLTMKSIAGFKVNALDINGGGGTNTLRANLDVDTKDPSGVDELVWTMTGTQAGWVADRQAQLLFNREIEFVDTDITGVTTNTITLPLHKLENGQIVLFRKTSGRDIPVNGGGRLKHNKTYYAVTTDDHTVKLASTAPNTVAGTTIALVRPVAPAANADPNRYTLTVIGPGETFTGGADKTTVFASTHATVELRNTIRRSGRSIPFQTGQPVVYHYSAGSGLTSTGTDVMNKQDSVCDSRE